VIQHSAPNKRVTSCSALSLRLCVSMTVARNLVPLTESISTTFVTLSVTVSQEAAECPSLQSHSFELCTVRHVTNRNASSRSRLMIADFSEIRGITSTGLEIEQRSGIYISIQGRNQFEGDTVRIDNLLNEDERNDEFGYTRSNTSKQL
jgi:hypothetical protein